MKFEVFITRVERHEIDADSEAEALVASADLATEDAKEVFIEDVSVECLERDAGDAVFEERRDG